MNTTLNLSTQVEGSARAAIADLRLKLAVKEAEIHKLQTLINSQSAAQQRLAAGW